VAAALSPLDAVWDGESTTVAKIERELGRLRDRREDGTSNMRTSVMTHCAWVPPEWLEQGLATLAGMAERHPSRTIILIPEPDEPDGLDAELSMRSFETGDRHVCTEVIELHLRGNRALAPASIVLPLLISDVPVFCRWRGEPLFGKSPWEQLVDVVDRLIVDSAEWQELRYRELAEAFGHTAVSDLVWARLHPWRVELAARWPAIAEQEIRISGPLAEGTLLRAWLGTRLHRAIRAIAEGDELSVRLGGEVLSGPSGPPLTPSDLLSAELDRLTRDPVYEEAVLASL
jgi:hypothetical protein